VRIVTWNCCRGRFEVKAPLLDRLHPDVAVIQEVARPVDAPSSLWYGSNPKQGLAVVAYNGYRLHPLPTRRGVQRHIVPIQVDGPHRFMLLAVWSQRNHRYPYVQGVIRAVELYRELIQAQPAVIVGDFNSNSIWDRRREGSRDHGALVRLLAELSLVSAYHTFHREAHGAETCATYFFQWKEDARYHIDYCFLPAVWADRLTAVEIGGFSEWATLSDHRPVLIDTAV
jgi:endonuclease/exonuclease/phosphatase family metal-dependent hydrolase